MHDVRPIAPLYAGGTLLPSVTVAGAAAHAEGALPGNQSGRGDFNQIQIANTTNQWAFVNFGRDTTEITAVTVATGYPIAPGGVVVVTVADEVAAVSVILSAAPGAATSVIFTRGTGT
jgi:hypothetical protein